MIRTDRARRGWRVGAPAAAALIALAVAAPRRSAPHRDGRQSVAQMAQPNVAGVLVTFEFDQTAPIADKVAIVFSSLAADMSKPPATTSPYGDSVVALFEFPVRQYSAMNTHAAYSRRMTNRAFLDARYIRVVNTGSRPWLASTISLTVAGQRILNHVAMYPRKANRKIDPRAGLGGWNPREWRPVYWETELFRYTHPAKVY
jgi:hypothetical protein